MSRFLDLFQYTEPTPEENETSLGYDEDARDGDGDGIVQEGTPFERPAPKRTTRKKSK